MMDSCDKIGTVYVKQPAWDDSESSAGTMVRGALWLLQVVGEGGTFTKNQLRDAFPRVAQVDRRIRDLRDYGWIVHSSAEDASLLAEDQRFVKVGVHVWNPEARREAASRKGISNKVRRGVMARDGYMCTLCGISGAEQYLDDTLTTAVLAVSRRTMKPVEGPETEVLVTECQRCRAGRASTPIDAGIVLATAMELNPEERRRLLRWMERGRRGGTALDRAWAAYRRVPTDLRQVIADQLRSQEP